MPPLPETPTHLVDVSHLAEDAAPVLAWFEWYADPERAPLAPDDLDDLVTALGGLVPYTALQGPVGDAATVLVAGGLGHSTDEHLDALDTVDEIAHPQRASPAPWRVNGRPRTDLGILLPEPSAGSGIAVPLQLPGIT